MARTSIQSVYTGPRCKRCAAPLRAGVATCWLCHANISPDGSIADATPAKVGTEFEPGSRIGQGFSLSSLLMFVTLVCVVLGVYSIAPGLGIPLGVIALIAWARTVSVLREEKDGTDGANMVLVFLRSVGFAITVLVMVAVGTFAAFFIICLAALGAMSR
jgi:hypothetical protein